MKTHKHKNILLFLLVVTLLLPSLDVNASFEHSGIGYNFSLDGNTDDFRTWLQGDDDWRYDSLGSGSSTIGSAGCLITAISMLIAYANPDMQDESTFNPGIFEDKASFSGSSYVWGSCSSVDSTFTYVGGSGNQVYYWDPDDALAEVHRLTELGYYVVLEFKAMNSTSSQHWSPVVGFESDGTPIVWDVNGKYYHWDYWSSGCYNGTWVAGGSVGGLRRIVYFKSSVQPSYEAFASVSTNTLTSGSSGSSDDTIEVSNDFDISAIGTAYTWSYEDLDTEITLSESNIDEKLEGATYENLTEEQATAYADWDYVLNGATPWYVTALRYAVIFIGIGSIVWGVFLYVGYWFDRTNNFLDLGVVELLTLGRLRTSDIEDECTFRLTGEHTGKRTVNHRAMLTVCGLAILFGTIIVSGLVSKVLLFILVKVKTIF